MKSTKKNIIHIANNGTEKYPSWTLIDKSEDLKKNKSDDESVWLINVHLNWNGNSLSSNFGFDIANLLRTEIKSKAPIIFYSPIRVKFFEKKSESEIKYKILFGRGTAFIEAPFKEQELAKLAEYILPLSNAALHDVTTMLCDLKGIVIDKLNHDLKFEADIDKVIASVTPYLSTLQKKKIGLDKFVTEIKARIKAKDHNGFLIEKLKFITDCNYELTAAGKDKPKDKSIKHKILLIDDLPEEIERAETFLKDEFTVVAAITGEEAINILTKDVKNEIVTVISDWRLFTDARQNYWQSLQGYEVLDFAAKNGIRSLFALTSQADFVVHHLRNLMGIRFSMFKKENLRTSDQWKVFSDVLFEACEKAITSRANILDEFPTWKKSWTEKGVEQKTLREQYIDFWNSIDRDSELNTIETKVDEMWNYLMNTKDPYLIGEEKYQDYKVSIKILKLQKILVLRRIWFGLWLNHLPSGKVGAESTKNLTEKVYKKIFGLPGDGSIPQRTMNLCIQLDKINKKFMLPEEIEWLTRKGLME